MNDRTHPNEPLDLVDTLTTAARALVRSESLEAALETLLRTALAAGGAASGSVHVQDPDRAALELVAAVPDEAAGRPPGAALDDPNDPAAVAARTRTPTFPDGRGSARADLPLVVSRAGVDEVVGVLSLAWPTGTTLSPTARTILEAIADLAAAAIDRARLASVVAERSEWFERMAHTDPLTGLANERTVRRILELELARAARQGGELSIALFDIDAFGALNDEAGFEVGDDALRAVASVLAASVRLVDTIGRIGADEFVLIAPGAAGATVARRVIDGVASLSVGGRQVSVSAGIARFPVDGTSADELLEAAAAALTAARSAGTGELREATARSTG
ncbi:MAG TPA: GGDEF domain-containing protein [Candidatus Limnocylindrales bacterium]|nr:GGDEF domain-containing protein [Candidatus Limnocylindrales bacterium]